MMGHGKHHKCAMCSMAKAMGMMPQCTDKSCTDPSHKDENKSEGEDENKDR